MDWSVVHESDGVRLILPSGYEEWVSLSDYQAEVIRFVDKVEGYGKQKDADWRYGKIIAGNVTPEFCAFLLGIPKPADTELYNKMTPFFTISLDNGFWSEHYGTELTSTGWQASDV